MDQMMMMVQKVWPFLLVAMVAMVILGLGVVEEQA